MHPEEYRASSEMPYHISCGGPVFREGENGVEIALLFRERDGKNASYHLTKGTLRHHETLEQCAVREVAEEAGIEANVGVFLGGFSDQFVSKTGYRDKTVLYFAMHFVRVCGACDSEHDRVEWYPLKEARTLLETTEARKREYLILDRLEEFLNIKKTKTRSAELTVS